MNLSLENTINQKFKKIFETLGLDPKFAVVKVSDRPDLSDFQCNGALALAKQAHKNPREIATSIAELLEKDSDFSKISIDGPGFINISIQPEFLAGIIDNISQDERLGCGTVENPHTVVLDFGGPNVAKALHVGHLRSGVIGESVQRIEKFVGNNVISDVHVGDWGTPMGMILAEIIEQAGDLSKTETYDIEAITEFYKKANIRCKEDETAKEKARLITAELQGGNALYRRAWRHIRQVSMEAIKQNYDALDINFNLWLGESDAHETCGEIIKLAKETKIGERSEGAFIIPLDDGSFNKPMPPVILEKSDGGVAYQTTDIATIKMRVGDLKAEEIVYFTDQRQALHFEQVFAAVGKLGFATDVKMSHVGFGTVNGKDGKPFKTRDGGVMTLENLINISKDKVRESLPNAGEVEGYGVAEIEKLVNQIAIGAIKFQDLKNNSISGYIFDLEDFAKFDGKTGPYVQYAVARINSILRKASENNLECGKVIISNPEERDLALKITQLGGVIMRAHNEKEPSVISDYTYTLAQTFSSFYNASPIMGAETPELARSRLHLAKLVRDILKQLLYLLGIDTPEVMLKKAEA